MFFFVITMLVVIGVVAFASYRLGAANTTTTGRVSSNENSTLVSTLASQSKAIATLREIADGNSTNPVADAKAAVATLDASA